MCTTAVIISSPGHAPAVALVQSMLFYYCYPPVGAQSRVLRINNNKDVDKQ